MRRLHLRLRWPSKSEVAVQIVLALLLALLASDFFEARSARPCFEPSARSAGANCYPWGGEGPVAGNWSYASKENYLRSALALLLVLITAILTPFMTPNPRVGLAALLVIPVLGFAGSEWLARLL